MLEVVGSQHRPNVWNASLVEARLIEAFGVLRRMPMTLRPAAMETAWPSYRHDVFDRNSQLLNREREEHDRIKKERNRSKLGATSAQIARMEEAICWPATYLAAKGWKEQSRAVCLAAIWRISGKRVSTGCYFERISRRTFYRRKLYGLNTIAIGLQRDGVPVAAPRD